MSQSNPKVTNIPINAAGGALTLITTTIMCSKVEVQEDPNYNAGVAQGLRGYYLDPESNHANPARDNPIEQTWLPNTAGENGRAYQPIIFGGDAGRVHGGQGNYVGAQGTPLLSLVSSVLATGVLLVEWP
jgi:hypothetical protein